MRWQRLTYLCVLTLRWTQLLERTLAFWKDEMIGDADGLAEGTRTDSRGPRLTSFQFPPLKGSGKTQLIHSKSFAVTQSPSVESAQAQCSLQTHLERACPDLAINLRLRHRRLPQTCYFSRMRHSLSLSHLSDRLLWEQQKGRSGRWAYSTCVDQYISKDQCSAGTCCNIRVRSSLIFFFRHIVKQNLQVAANRSVSSWDWRGQNIPVSQNWQLRNWCSKVPSLYRLHLGYTEQISDGMMPMCRWQVHPERCDSNAAGSASSHCNQRMTKQKNIQWMFFPLSEFNVPPRPCTFVVSHICRHCWLFFLLCGNGHLLLLICVVVGRTQSA